VLLRLLALKESTSCRIRSRQFPPGSFHFLMATLFSARGLDDLSCRRMRITCGWSKPAHWRDSHRPDFLAWLLGVSNGVPANSSAGPIYFPQLVEGSSPRWRNWADEFEHHVFERRPHYFRLESGAIVRQPANPSRQRLAFYREGSVFGHQRLCKRVGGRDQRRGSRDRLHRIRERRRRVPSFLAKKTLSRIALLRTSPTFLPGLRARVCNASFDDERITVYNEWVAR
jgi:hypothetical protein